MATNMNEDMLGDAQNHSLFENISESPDFDSTRAYSNETYTTTTMDKVDNLNPNMLLAGFMMGLVAVFSLALCYLIFPSLFRWLRRKIPVSAAQINRRYETIEGWLITKRAKVHCNVCDEVQRRFGSSKNGAPTIHLSSSHDTAETILCDKEQHQCLICMECFTKDDCVSWSPSTECDHVFHHACIKTWLLHHERCPCCRAIILSVDKPLNAITPGLTRSGEPSIVVKGARFNRIKSRRDEQLAELFQQRQHRLDTTYFCLEEGLITLDRSLTINTADKHKTDHRENDEESLKSYRIKKHISNGTIRRFLTPNIQPADMIAQRSLPRNITSKSDIIVTVSSPRSECDGSDTGVDDEVLSSQQLDRADSTNDIVDIEMEIKTLPIISNNDAIDRG